MKKSKKLLSLLLTLIMVVGMLPVMASAADGIKTEGLVTSKTATLEKDGTYTINIEAYATGKTTTTITENAVPLDVVLVLDQSGSMEGNNITVLKEAVTTFVNRIQSNANKYNVDHRIAVVGYASSDTVLNFNKPFENTELLSTPDVVQYRNIKSSDYANALVSANVDGVVNSRLTTAIDRVGASGGTCTAYGLEMAKGIFDNTPADGHTRIVVLFTDGNTDSDENDVIDYAVKLRRDSGATIFTVGFGSGLDTDFLTAVSSDMDLNYNIVYSGDLNTSKTYYYYRSPKNMGFGGESAGILSAQYMRGGLSGKAWRHDTMYNSVSPKNGANDTNSNHIYFYDKISSTPINKYMLTANNADSLNNIFSTISTASTSSSTSVTLDSSAILKDVIPASFDCSNAKYTAKSVKVSTMNGDTPTAWGAETVLKSNAAVSNNTVSVDGFDYAAKYVASLNKANAAKLVVTITGIRPTDDAVTNEKIFTNEASSGIYFNNEMVQELEQPTTILTGKTYVVDYAKPFTMNPADWKMTNGTVYGSFTKDAVSVKNGALDGMTYTPNTMQWDGADTFYVFGQSSDSTVKSATANANGNLWSKVNVIPANNVYYEDDFVDITYSGDDTWKIEGSNTDQKEVANSIHGGMDNLTLADDETYSDGSAHMAVANDSNRPTASFTFTGTGVDVYSRTNNYTGTVMAVLKDETGNAVNKVMIVDNLLKDKDFYQVPTISFNNLPFGNYDVTIYVTTAAGDRTTYYLDGVRVYNPMQDTTLYDVNERNAKFVEVRDMLLDANDFGVKDGFVFTDSDNTADVATYNTYGPKNEVYLAKGQAIMFQVTSEGNGTDYYIGMSAPEGSTTVMMTNGKGTSPVTVGHASDLYYKITPDAQGNVRIENTSDNILAISKLRVAGDVPTKLFAMAKAPLMSYANSFSTLVVVPYEEGAVDPIVDSNDPIVVPDVDPIDPEPTSDPEPTPDPVPATMSIVKTLFKFIKNLFSWR